MTLRPCLRVLTGLFVAAALVACGSSDDDDPGAGGGATPQGVQGQTGLCADLALLQPTVNALQNLDSSSTIEEANAARDAVNLALTELQEAGNELTTDQNAKLQDAFETFNAELDSVGSGGASTSEPLGDAAVPLKASADALAAAEEEVREESGCPSP